ncbi:MAG: class I SAM-dependent methyltransferase [Desulfobacterales bacterium]|uniref:Class I SAM-dependent methyltransferase n=1 Tax=Candidatus Desulfatibia vada TaxID=2841696 RepID=A0A8J6P002_9BACT|nr:class I SAM-dependent methyltransferase [Candidatus Desulfatibia vada]MBL6972239.1 class I SAM-dependent methyltransferase [Desulfobacterales bacterium]
MISYYRKLVAEHSRMQAFQNGITAAVRPGDTVCEIGAGLGTYAFMASRAGAAKVYAIEEGPVIELARKLYKANQNDLGVIEFIKQYSTLVHLEDKVDVVIYEDFECQGLSPLQESVLKDASRRFLKPGGTFIPYGLELYWVPLQAENIWQKEVSCLDKNEEKVLGLDFALTRELTSNERIQTPFEADSLLSSELLIESLNFAEKQQLEFSRELTFKITTSGTLHGFGSWADFLFPGGHRFSLSYEKPVTAYSRAFFPLPEPVPVETGDCIRMKVGVVKKPLPNRHTWSWWGEIDDRHGRSKFKWQSSTLHLSQFQKQDIEFSRYIDTDYCPVLNEEGHLRKFILERMNGNMTIEQIANELLVRFPENFPSLGKALTKVTRLAKKCSINA